MYVQLYEKDADLGCQLFDLKMTDRVNMNMAGVPEKTFELWASKFIAKGFKVGVVYTRRDTSITPCLEDQVT